MKKLLTVTLLFYALTSFPQTTLFKDNLFRSSQKSVEVIDKSRYILLKFEGSDTAAIYRWEYEPLIDAFNTHYLKLEGTKDITMEAFRVFYAVQKYLILNTGKQNRLVAGSMGFENSRIYLRKVGYTPEKTYEDNLAEAINRFIEDKKEITYKYFIVKGEDSVIDTLLYKHYKVKGKDKKEVKYKHVMVKGEESITDTLFYKHFIVKGEDKKEVTYKHFIVKGEDSIIDTLLDKSNPHSKSFLKKYGPANFREYLDKQITETYLYFLDSIEDALTSYNILSDQISISEKDTAILNKEISVLEKKTFTLNNIGVELKDKIKGLEKETETDKLKELGRKFRDSLNTASPFPQIPDSLFNGRFVPVIKFKQLSLYRDLEKVSINMLLDKVGKNTQNRKKADSLQQSLIQTNITQKKLLLSKLKNYNKELSNNRENIYETIQKIKKIKESALTEYSYEILNMRIDSIEVEINQTFIEKFVVYGKIEYYGFQKNKRIDVNQTYVTLRNKVPIGISSLNSIDNNNKDLKLPFLKIIIIMQKNLQL